MSAPLYLLDTNIISHMMVNADGLAAQCAQRLIAKDPSVQMSALLVMPLDEAVALHYARLRADLEAKGTPIGPNDTLIAAHALALDATLVSGDAEFCRVPGLRVENWLLAATSDP